MVHELPCLKCWQPKPHVSRDKLICESNETMPDKMSQLLQEHMSKVFGNFNQLRELNILYDFTICVGNKKLQTHRVILAASSDYFKAMFSQDSKELNTGKVFLQNIDANAVEAIVNYIYNGKIDLNEENIEDILLAATILQVQIIQSMCTHFIEGQIDTSNCLGVASLAERCSLLDLHCKALNHCYDNFNQIICEREFLDLDDQTLARILSDDMLKVEDETNVFNAVIAWIEVDREQRISKLDRLMECVRFATIDPATLVTLSASDLIKTSPRCQELIGRAKDYLLLKDHPELQQQHADNLVTRPRHARRMIYAVGGAGGTDPYKCIASAEVYDPVTEMWTEIQPMIEKRCSVGLTTLGNSIYAVGGHDGVNHLKSVERFDKQQGKWIKDVAKMNYERSSVAVATLGEFMYAIGGQPPGPTSRALERVERYNPRTNTWDECAPMQYRRLGAGVAVLYGRIYVMGGSDSYSAVHRSVECYDPGTDKWTEVAPMLKARKHFGSCSCLGLIYAVGGRNSYDGQLDSAEVYNPAINKWVEIPSMRKKRAGIGLVGLSGRVYAIGGQSGDDRLSDVEAYDPTTMTWQPKTPMKHCRLGGAMTVHPI